MPFCVALAVHNVTSTGLPQLGFEGEQFMPSITEKHTWNQSSSSPSTSIASASSSSLQGLLQVSTHSLSDGQTTDMWQGSGRLLYFAMSHVPTERAPTVGCIWALPASMSSDDIVQLLQPCTSYVDRVTVIRDQHRHHTAALLHCFDSTGAMQVQNILEGAAPSSTSREILHVALVDKLVSLPDTALDELVRQTGGFFEQLPTCPTCLERLDDDYLSDILRMQQTSDASMAWQDNNCLSCALLRSSAAASYSDNAADAASLADASTSAAAASASCSNCTRNDGLWACLACGFVGCGRQQFQDTAPSSPMAGSKPFSPPKPGTTFQHSLRHYHDTGTRHALALELSTGRVWNYNSDCYVHRLIATMTDGDKPASAPAGTDPTQASSTDVEFDKEKLSSLQDEYVKLLSLQLESQRRFFDEKLHAIEREASDELQQLDDELLRVEQEVQALEEECAQAKGRDQDLDQKLADAKLSLTADLRKLQDLKQTNKQALEQQKQRRKEAEETRQSQQAYERSLSRRIDEITAMIRDTKTHLRQSRAVGVSQEIMRHSAIVLGEDTESASTTAAGRRRARRDRNSRK